MTLVPPLSGERVGLLLMVASAGCFALMAALIQLFLPHTPPQAIVLSRGVTLAATFALLARRRGVPVLGTNWRMLLTRGLLGYVALSIYFYSAQHLPLGDAVLLQYSHPVFVALVAPFLLREPTTKAHWILVGAAFAGVALIVGPSGELRGPAILAVLGAMCSGLAYMTVRYLARTEHPLTILVWFPLTTVPGSLVFTLLSGAAAWPDTSREWLGHLGVAASGLLGQLALTAGLVRTTAARGTASSMAGPVFGLLFGLLFFGTLPGWTSLLGTLVVVAALALLAREEPAT